MPTGVHVELVLAVGGRFPEATGPAQAIIVGGVSCPFTNHNFIGGVSCPFT